MDSRSKDKSNSRAKDVSLKDLGVLEPEQKLKWITDNAYAVEVDYNLETKRYYRSGVELLRQATVYQNEGNLETAFILYMRYITIFVDKITKHPQYDKVPTVEKERTKQRLREVIPIAEQLKIKLLDSYKLEYKRYLETFKEKERIQEERLKEERRQRQKEEEEKRKREELAAARAAINTVVAEDAKAVQRTLYPTVKNLENLHIEEAQSSKEKNTPAIDRSTKPLSIAANHSKFALREIVLPSMLMDDFLALSFDNTVSNRETCGIIAGTLKNNKLLVTHLLIPQQTGSSDSCATHNEEDIFDYQDQHSLITLGWIHTHPTQTAFLSSVDLHTHCSYQLMMAESIAIVCAPKYEETGYFVLTPDYGLNYIANCYETGFHPHPTDPPLYMKANHYKLDPTITAKVVDLRRTK